MHDQKRVSLLSQAPPSAVPVLRMHKVGTCLLYLAVGLRHIEVSEGIGREVWIDISLPKSCYSLHSLQGPDSRLYLSSRCQVSLYDQVHEKVLSRSNAPPSLKFRVESSE